MGTGCGSGLCWGIMAWGGNAREADGEGGSMWDVIDGLGQGKYCSLAGEVDGGRGWKRYEGK